MGLDIPNSNQMFLGTRRNITKKANRLFYGSVLGSWLIDKNAPSCNYIISGQNSKPQKKMHMGENNINVRINH